MKVSLVLVLLAAPALAGSPPPPVDPPGFSVVNLDRQIAPCDDFYQFACGGWRAAHPVPPDQPRFTRFLQLVDRNRAVLKEILEERASAAPGRTGIDAKLGDLYASCMDETGVESRGLGSIQPWLARIEALGAIADLPPLLADLHAGGTNALFRFGSQQDFQDATRVVAAVDQGGLGLPDRDDYLVDDKAERRVRYRAHVQRMFELLGEDPGAASVHAEVVLAVETELARGSLDRVSRREAKNLDHRMVLTDLGALSPAFDWVAYVKATGAPEFAELNVAVPAFVQATQGALHAHGLPAWKTYLRWRVIDDAAPLLSAALVDEDFQFSGKYLQGAKENLPRWKRCVDAVDTALPEALGRRFVEKTYGPEARRRMDALLDDLDAALARDIRELAWMSEATRPAALGKLKAIARKVGHPKKWRDYADVTMTRDDLFGNAARARAWEFRRQLGKIGQPVDRTDWLMSPPTVNAYYEPSENDINFPAGILQPPFFDRALDDAVNYGAIGSVIGHELTHGFDDQGRKFDAHGNLRDWWTAEDGARFEERAACIVDQYAAYEPIPGTKLNGKLTLGENTADNGGVRIAYMALRDSLKRKPAGKVEGFTPEQRFFLGWAQVWCQNTTDEMARFLAQVDPHSPDRFRVNGVVSNMPEFASAFSCKAGSPMVRKDACRVW